MPRPFIGLIVVPFVGNVAEHFSAVRLAYRNSSTSRWASPWVRDPVALVASPWRCSPARHRPRPDAGFDPLELARPAAAAVGASLVARGGETNWLEGLQLVTIYLVVGVAVWLR